MLTLYFQFTAMPGYKCSTFFASMENALLKMDSHNAAIEDPAEYAAKSNTLDQETVANAKQVS